jgi:hypothetical protein
MDSVSAIDNAKPELSSVVGSAGSELCGVINTARSKLVGESDTAKSKIYVFFKLVSQLSQNFYKNEQCH